MSATAPQVSGANHDPSAPSPRGRIPFQPALDGLRGVLLFAVLAFHSEFPWAVGGFLPLPTFFVLSGYLITSLFLAEWESTGRIGLTAFWGRRLRRLMPAALLCLGGMSLFALLFATPDQLVRLRADVFWSLAYLANWHFIVSETDYTALFVAPSPIQHFWSLAVEEQFYLAYPLVVVAGLRIGNGSRGALAAILGALLLLSVAASWALSASGASIDRLYYGTDSRGAELAVGCLLGVLLHGRTLAHPLARRALEWAGLLGLGAMVWLWTFVELEWRGLYTGGLLAYAVLTSVVIAAAVQPRGPVRVLLSGRTLGWAGRLSYGGYIFHWPLFLALSPERTGLDGWALFALRVTATLTVSQLSYTLLETPIRTARALSGRRAALALPAAMVTVVLAVTATAGGGSDGAIDLDGAAKEMAELEAQAPNAAHEPRATRSRARPRIAVYGDSTAMRLGLALGKTYREGKRAVPRPGVAQMGCGLMEEGTLRFRGLERDRREDCGDRDALYGQSLVKSKPDVAVVLFGPWDVADRRLPGDDRWRKLGDPKLDAVLRAEIEAMVDLLSRDGALVIWVTSPRIQVMAPGNVPPQRPYPESDPRRMERFNELVYELGERRPDVVRIVDLAAYMSTLPPEQDRRFRPDGVHPTNEGAESIARDWLAEAILRAYRESAAHPGG